MFNKVIAVVLLITLIGSGVLGYFTLNQSMDIQSLKQQLEATEQEKIELENELGNMITSFQNESTADINAIDELITGLSGQLNGLAQNLNESTDALETRIDTVKSDISTVQSDISSVESNQSSLLAIIENLIPGVAADKVYQAIEKSVVEISDGTNIIGSGFVYDDLGHIVTAAHVVENVSRIYVIRSDGYFSKATVRGIAYRSDIAVLTMQQFAPDSGAILSSENPEAGEPVIAVGHPYSLTESITVGVISQLHRLEDIGANSTSGFIAGLIQFDAAVNPGSSGCPLFDSDGNIIGMVVAGIDPTIGSGISFAVSLGRLKNAVDDIIEHGKTSYPHMGIFIEELTPITAASNKLDNITGLLIRGISPGGPADIGGLSHGDVISSISGTRVTTAAAFFSYLAENTVPGTTITIQVIRDDTTIEVTVTLDETSEETKWTQIDSNMYND